MNIQMQFTSLKDVRRKKKKKWPRVLFDVIVVIFILVNGIGLYYGNILYKQAFEINTKEELDQYEKNKSTFNERRYSELQKEDVSVASKHNYRLYGTFIKNAKATKDTIILLHGIGGSRWTVMKYLDMYLDKGFNVLIYDSRNHGSSKGDNVTYGFYEKDDLDKWVEWVYKNNKDGIIGVHGDDIGAATSLLHSKINETKKRVNFYISDSSYSDLSDFFTYKFKKDYDTKYGLFLKPLIFYMDKVNKLKNGFYLKEVSPISILKDVKTPIMFIYGSEDSDLPESMSEDMYKIKEGSKKIYIAPNSGHCEAFLNNPDEYTDKVYGFIDSCMQKNN